VFRQLTQLAFNQRQIFSAHSPPACTPKVKVAHTPLPSVGFRSWSRFLAVSLQVRWVITPAVGCHYFPPGLKLPPQPLRGLLPVLLLVEQRHSGCKQLRLLPDSVATAIWTRALLHLSPTGLALGYRAMHCYKPFTEFWRHRKTGLSKHTRNHAYTKSHNYKWFSANTISELLTITPWINCWTLSSTTANSYTIIA